MVFWFYKQGEFKNASCFSCNKKIQLFEEVAAFGVLALGKVRTEGKGE